MDPDKTARASHSAPLYVALPTDALSYSYCRCWLPERFFAMPVVCCVGLTRIVRQARVKAIAALARRGAEKNRKLQR
jgi:hypothetical protein